MFLDPPVIDKNFLEKLKKNPLKFKAGTKAKIEVPFTGKMPHTYAFKLLLGCDKV